MTSPVAAHEAHLEFMLHAKPLQAWQALTKDTTLWWPQTFYTSPKTRRFIIEPKLGGMMGEITGPGEGLVWYRVIGVEKPTSLLLAGYLLPPWAGPASSMLRLALTAAGKDETRLELVEYTYGVLGACNSVEGWRELFEGHFVPYVNKPPKRGKHRG
jgi:hypothetical protein